MTKRPPAYDISFSPPFRNVAEMLRFFIVGGIVLITLIPLLGDYGEVLFPFGRDIVFRSLIEVLLLAALILFAIDARFRPSFSLIGASLALFLTIAAVSTAFSPQPAFSMWGIIFRSQGFFSLLHFFFFFLLLTATLQRWQDWKYVLTAAFAASIPVTLFTFFEKFFSHSARVFSTLNNPNFFGAYLLLIFFLTLAFFLIAQKKEVRFILGAGILLQLFALFNTYTRGAYLGLFAGGSFFAILYPGISSRVRKATIAIVISIPILYAILFPFQGGPIKVIAPRLSQRLFAPADIFTTASSRFEAWHAAWEGIKTKPFLGYGPENFIIPFDTFYRGSLDHLHFLETWFDRAHNIFLDTGAALGIPGIAAYILIFAAAFLALRGVRKRAKSFQVKLVSHALSATLIAYLFQNLVNFDTTTSMVYFTGILAFIVFLERRVVHASNEKFSRDRIFNVQCSIFKQFSKFQFQNNHIAKRVLYGLALLYVPLLFYSLKEWNFDFLRANYMLNKAENFLEAKKYDTAFALYEKGLAIDAAPVNPHLRHRYANALLSFAIEFKGRRPDLVKERLLRVFQIVDDNINNEFPFFTRNYMMGGITANILLELKEDKETYRALADRYFAQALERSPNRPSILIEWAKTDFLTGRYEDGKQKLLKAIAINDKVAQAYFMLGLGSLYEGKEEEADRYFREANARGIDMKDPERLLQIVFVYNEIGDYEKTAQMLERVIALDPNNIQHYASLATVYKKLGKIEKAKETAKKILEIEPEAARDVEEFIKDLEKSLNRSETIHETEAKS